MTKALLTIITSIILAASLLGCAGQMGSLQFALGTASVSKTDDASTTEGGSISDGFANVLVDIVKAVGRLIPGNGSTEITVKVPDAVVTEEDK